MRRQALPLPRFVTPESIDEGDTIRVTWKVGDLELSRTGKVGRIADEGFTGYTKTFLTPEGHELARVNRASKKLRFTLLAEAPKAAPIPLFEMDGG